VADSAPERAEEATVRNGQLMIMLVRNEKSLPEETALPAAFVALATAPDTAEAAAEAADDTPPAAPWKLVWELGKSLAKQLHNVSERSRYRGHSDDLLLLARAVRISVLLGAAPLVTGGSALVGLDDLSRVRASVAHARSLASNVARLAV
jgi:hypothetical protein